MKLGDKILSLRRQRSLSQEELADKLYVSRQAISRWEVGSALPDASNLLQLSRLFGVSADYLLNDDMDSDTPAAKAAESPAPKNLRKVVACCMAALGLAGNFVIYILSRCIEVMVPRIVREGGERWYQYSSNITDHSYRHFIRAYDLEFLAILLWAIFLAGTLYLLCTGTSLPRLLNRLKHRHHQPDQDNSEA